MFFTRFFWCGPLGENPDNAASFYVIFRDVFVPRRRITIACSVSSVRAPCVRVRECRVGDALHSACRDRLSAPHSFRRVVFRRSGRSRGSCGLTSRRVGFFRLGTAGLYVRLELVDRGLAPDQELVPLVFTPSRICESEFAVFEVCDSCSSDEACNTANLGNTTSLSASTNRFLLTMRDFTDVNSDG